MPTTVSGFTFFEDQFVTGRWEGLDQFTDGFNGASANAIVLSPGNVRGRRRNTTFFTTNSSFVARRDPTDTGNTSWQTHTNVTHTQIKVYRSSRYRYRAQDFADLGLSEEEGQFLWGQQFGALQAQDMLNTALAALTGAIGAIGSGAQLDITGETTTTMHFEAVNRGLAKMGDMSQSIRALTMHSKPWHDLIGDSITNQKWAPEGANLALMEGTTRTMGKTALITDSTSFVNTTPTPDQYSTLALVNDAIRVELNPADERMAAGVITGDGTNTPANISYGLMVDYAFTVSIKGVRYKEASVDNPDASTIADSSNWSLVASSGPKLGPGIEIITE